MNINSRTGIPDKTSVIRRAFWPTAEFSDISNFAYTEDPDLVILNGPGTPHVGAFNCATQRFRWKAPIMLSSSVTYHPHIRRVLGYARAQRALVELDADSGEVIREISQTELGPIGECVNVHYATPCTMPSSFKVYNTQIEEEPDLVLLADAEHHVAGLLRLSTGRFVWHFGEYGIAGSDLQHLSAPRDMVWTLSGGAWVADYANHRLLGLNSLSTTPEVTHQWIFPRPTSVAFTYNSPGSNCFSANAAVSTEGHYQPLTLVLSDFDEVGITAYTSLLGWAPIASNQVSFNPWDPTLLQVNQWNSAFEVEWMNTPSAWRHMTRFTKPYLHQQHIASNTSWSSEPIVGLINERMLLRVFTSGATQVRIEMPEPMHRLLATPANYAWVPIAEMQTTGQRMLLHAIDLPPAVFRVTLQAESADISASLYVEGM